VTLLRVASLAIALALVAAAVSSAEVHHPAKKKKTVRIHRSTVSQVVVSRGRPVEIAFVDDSGSGFATSLANAVQMAVDEHPSIRGFPIQVDQVDVKTCGDPPTAATAALSAANAITADKQNVAVLGQVCSYGFAQALPVYEAAGVVAISGSATNPSLPAAAPTVFDRTVVDDNGFDVWYAAVSSLPSDVSWRQAYSQRFGAAPSEFADLYYDAAGLLIRDLDRVATFDAAHELVMNRGDLAAAVRGTTSYRGVSCFVAIDASTGNRIDDPVALDRCAAGTG
jgi:hypothetical protein